MPYITVAPESPLSSHAWFLTGEILSVVGRVMDPEICSHFNQKYVRLNILGYVIEWVAHYPLKNSCPLEPQNVTKYGNKILAYVIKD